LKFQAIADKTEKILDGYFLSHPLYSGAVFTWSDYFRYPVTFKRQCI